MAKSRTRHTAAFKAKGGLAAIREEETVGILSKRFGLHPNQIYTWKREFLANAERVFANGASRDDDSERVDELLRKIGELTVERDFLSKGLGRRG